MAKTRIMIVDDEPDFCRLTALGLKKMGYEVITTNDGQEALDLIKENRPDLVLMDIGLMGQSDGIEVAKQIRSRFNIPVVYLTGYADDRTLARAKITEPFGYVVKPFEYKELKIAIEIALYKADAESKLKALTEKLQASTASFHNIVEKSSDGTIVIDKNGIIRFANPAATTLFGRKTDDLLGEPFGFPVVAGEVAGIDILRNGIDKGIAEMRVVETEWQSEPAYLLLIRDVTAQKRAERNIEELAKFPEENPNPVLRIAENGTILYANKASSPVLDTWQRQVWQQIPKGCRERITEVLKSDKPSTFEFECPGCTFLFTFAPVVKFGYVNVYGVDITERKKAEVELRQSEELLKSIINLLPIRIFWKDKNSVYLGCNNIFAKDAGVNSPDEVIGKDDFQFIWKEQAELYRSDDEMVRKTGKDKLNYVEPSTTPQGDRIWLSTSKVPLTDVNGNIIGVLGAYEDITERKKADEENRRLKQQMEFILGATKTGIDIIDSEFNIRYINEEWKKIYGEPAGRKCYEYFMGRSKACPGCGIPRALETKKIAITEVVLVKENNRPIQVTTMPFKDENGDWLVAEVNTDITELKHKEAELKILNEELRTTIKKLASANRELHDFVRAASHDLKTPLGGITKLAEWISTDYADKLDGGGRDLINSLLARVYRMNDLIGGILKYSKIVSARKEQSTINLNELVLDVINMLTPPANITITVENPLPVVECEKTHIMEVFQNLLSNAIKFMDKPQGEVKIGCVEENGFWKFSISDNGPGIEGRHFERVFELFGTLHPRDKFEGIGIGLAVVKKIVELYGGRIWLESERAKGSNFFFTWPKQKVGVINAKLDANIAC